jgi:lipid A disaccharide synthetase
MSELYVQPQVLADAGRSLATQRSVLADVADALPPALAVVAAALPGSRTAEVAEETAATLATAVRAAAAELAELAGALTVAARDYRVVEQTTASGIERNGRVPV